MFDSQTIFPVFGVCLQLGEHTTSFRRFLLQSGKKNSGLSLSLSLFGDTTISVPLRISLAIPLAHWHTLSLSRSIRYKPSCDAIQAKQPVYDQVRFSSLVNAERAASGIQILDFQMSNHSKLVERVSSRRKLRGAAKGAKKMCGTWRPRFRVARG